MSLAIVARSPVADGPAGRRACGGGVRRLTARSSNVRNGRMAMWPQRRVAESLREGAAAHRPDKQPCGRAFAIPTIASSVAFHVPAPPPALLRADSTESFSLPAAAVRWPFWHAVVQRPGRTRRGSATFPQPTLSEPPAATLPRRPAHNVPPAAVPLLSLSCPLHAFLWHMPTPLLNAERHRPCAAFDGRAPLAAPAEPLGPCNSIPSH